MKEWTYKQKWMLIEALSLGVISFGIGMYVGYGIGHMDTKCLDIIIDTSKELKEIGGFCRKGAWIYVVPEEMVEVTKIVKEL